MSGALSSVEASGVVFRPPFTAVQWKELERQALIYKYLMAGLPVPTELVVPIQRSFESISARFFHQSSLGYCSYYGKKIDPEPGRCRRTDGKKWRCSKDAYPDSKYCERHMHRGRNRSRKPVESQYTSQSLSTVMSSSTSGSSSRTGSFQNLPLRSIVDNEDSLLGGNASKWQIEPLSCGINNKEYSYGAQEDFELMNNAAMSRQRQQHCFFGSDIGSAKQESNSMRPFFDGWPKARDSWSNLDDQRYDNNTLSTTQLSISVPTPLPEISARGACSPNDD